MDEEKSLTDQARELLLESMKQLTGEKKGGANMGEEETETVRGRDLKDIIADAMDACLADAESTAAEKLQAITEAVDVYYKLL